MSTKEGNVKFGLDQITNRTPAFARWIFRAVLYLAAFVNFILSVVVEIPPDVALIIGKYSIYAVTIVHGLSKMWGIDIGVGVPGKNDYQQV